MTSRVPARAHAAEQVASPAKQTEKQHQEELDLKKPVPPSEFGGVFGTGFLTLALPVVIYWVWASINFNNGHLLAPKVCPAHARAYYGK